MESIRWWTLNVDYAQWVERLRRFVLDLQQRSPAESAEQFAIEISPPLDEERLQELAQSVDCGLPPPLRRFLGAGASSIHFRYACSYFETEDTFCVADQLAEWREECLALASSFEPDFPLDRAFWRHALPLIHYPDGDGVALWVHDPDNTQPPVIYLKHSDEGFLLSRTFDEFLTHWERLGYTGANELKDYRNPDGFLDSTIPKAVELREQLGLIGRGTG